MSRALVHMVMLREMERPRMVMDPPPSLLRSIRLLRLGRTAAAGFKKGNYKMRE